MAYFPHLVLLIAPLKVDTNTCCFQALGRPNIIIVFGETSVTVFGKVHSGVSVNLILSKLIADLEVDDILNQSQHLNLASPHQDQVVKSDPHADAMVDQDTFWAYISKFFVSGDIIMTETGTASSGGLDFVLPSQTTMINSAAWLSIGHMLGASVGVPLAQRDKAAESIEYKVGRTILFGGDGSFQMTVQPVSNLIHNRLDVINLLINNDGYTIERLTHGMDAEYNYIQP